jgi:signal transduction histidine kinase/ligand-binding sensor domain-containing protein/DNA-binding NarL/FixJ family response regulator
MVCHSQHLIRSIGVVFLALAFHSTVLFSQLENYTIEPVPKTPELSESTVFCALQDSEGFMWLGTRNGLYRYDGLNYKAFRNNPYNPLLTPGGPITGIAEDRDNILWIASGSSLFRYDKYFERFERIIDTALMIDMRNMSDIRKILDDKKGNLWLGTHMDGLVRFEKKYEKVYKDLTYTPTDTTRKWEMRPLLMDRNGIIWTLSDGRRFWGYNPQSDSYAEVVDVPCELSSLLEDRSGRIWATTACGLYLFDIQSTLFERQLYQPWNPNRLNSDIVCSIMEDSSGNLWVTTFDGVYKYSPELKLLYHWPYNDPYSNSIYDPDDNPFTYEDFAGTIWIFNREGILKLNKMQENFKVINPDPPVTNANRGILLLDESSLLYGTTEGYYEFDRETDSYIAHNLSNTLCNCIFKDTHGILWIGTRNGLYRRVDSDNGTVEHVAYHHIPGDSSSLPGNYIHIIFEDSSGRLWIGCQFAMPCYYDRENDCFIHLVDDPDNPFPSDHKPYIFHETSHNDLIAAAYGAYKIIPPLTRISKHAIMASDVVEIIPVEPVNNILTGFWVSCMDSRGTVWFGSNDMGLFKWVDDSLPDIRSKGKWTIYTEMDGLAGNKIMRIEEDLYGNLWIGTTTGLSRFNPISETFTNFYTQNGLPSNLFLKSGTRSPTGELFLGTNAGLVSFYPDSIKLNTSIPPVRITSFKVHNQEVIPDEGSILNRSIQFTDEVRLSHNLNTFTIGFAVLNYIEPERNQHKYMLEGLDEDWVFSGLNHNVTYTNLKPGNYIFRATGSNNDGLWNKEGVALSIRVLPPPWRTWWAYIIYGFILTGIILLYRRYLLNRARLQTDLEVERIEKEKILELDHMKSRFFANISHEFRTPLTLITGPIDDLLKSAGRANTKYRNLLGMMKRNTQRLQQLISELLELSRLETGRMQLKVSTGDMGGFLRSIASSFLSLAEKKRIRYEIDIKEEPGAFYFDKDKLEKIVTNLISNALKFTREGDSVRVRADYPSSPDHDSLKQVRILISDTGPGIPEKEREKIFDRFHRIDNHESRYTEGTGIGLALVKELVDLYRGKIELESEVGKGSTFRVFLPISKEAFSENEIVEVQPETEEIPIVHAEPLSDKTDQSVTDQAVTDLPLTDQAFTSQEETVKIHAGTGGTKAETGGTRAERPMILVVEDNEDLREYIAQQLDTRYRILEAEDGREGLQRAMDHIPDLVISDIMMPDMDGVEMCEQLKMDHRTSHIPLIMLTAKADKPTKMESYEKGADDYIIKPFDAEELQSRVKNLIEQRKRLRERYRKEFLTEPVKADGLPEQTDNFLSKVLNLVQSNLSDSGYNVEQLCHDVGLSQSQLYRKLMALTDHSPVEFIRNIRLKAAAEMFQNGATNVSTVLYSTGFNTPSHFSHYFRELYGVNPSDYIRKLGLND